MSACYVSIWNTLFADLIISAEKIETHLLGISHVKTLDQIFLLSEFISVEVIFSKSQIKTNEQWSFIM